MGICLQGYDRVSNVGCCLASLKRGAQLKHNHKLSALSQIARNIFIPVNSYSAAIWRFLNIGVSLLFMDTAVHSGLQIIVGVWGG